MTLTSKLALAPDELALVGEPQDLGRIRKSELACHVDLRRLLESFSDRAGFPIERKNSMKRNLGKHDRSARIVAAMVLVAASIGAPWPEGWRYAVLIPSAAYFAFTALAGTCLGYRLMGLSTCPAKSSR